MTGGGDDLAAYDYDLPADRIDRARNSARSDRTRELAEASEGTRDIWILRIHH